mmetsp:Transcript_28364/g.68133  ORF Transcript_28364/g.68133 Transcript_28364/m.68133 type:complete len:185 (+) Transcript_28364:74-628(+)
MEVGTRAAILDVGKIFPFIGRQQHFLRSWPSEEIRLRCCRAQWNKQRFSGEEGVVVYTTSHHAGGAPVIFLDCDGDVVVCDAAGVEPVAALPKRSPGNFATSPRTSLPRKSPKAAPTKFCGGNSSVAEGPPSSLTGRSRAAIVSAGSSVVNLDQLQRLDMELDNLRVLRHKRRWAQCPIGALAG